MKKLLSTLAVATALTTSAQAGAVIDLEVGGGAWIQSAPTGTLGEPGATLDLTSQLNLAGATNTYMWAVIDHLVPIIPNFRFEMSNDVFAGQKLLQVTYFGYTFNNTVNSTLSLANQDYILYWGVPFATWIPFIDEVDFGLGAKVFDVGFSAADTLTNTVLVDKAFPAFLPYGYLKLRVEPPFVMGLGLEYELKYLVLSDPALGSIGVNESIYKIDWGIEAPIPIIELDVGVEAGYKSFSLDVSSSVVEARVAYSGIFFGVYGKFGI